jgi:hypothetical protein
MARIRIKNDRRSQLLCWLKRMTKCSHLYKLVICKDILRIFEARLDAPQWKGGQRGVGKKLTVVVGIFGREICWLKEQSIYRSSISASLFRLPCI